MSNFGTNGSTIIPVLSTCRVYSNSVPRWSQLPILNFFSSTLLIQLSNILVRIVLPSRRWIKLSFSKLNSNQKRLSSPLSSSICSVSITEKYIFTVAYGIGVIFFGMLNSTSNYHTLLLFSKKNTQLIYILDHSFTIVFTTCCPFNSDIFIILYRQLFYF